MLTNSWTRYWMHPCVPFSEGSYFQLFWTLRHSTQALHIQAKHWLWYLGKRFKPIWANAFLSFNEKGMQQEKLFKHVERLINFFTRYFLEIWEYLPVNEHSNYDVDLYEKLNTSVLWLELINCLSCKVFVTLID